MVHVPHSKTHDAADRGVDASTTAGSSMRNDVSCEELLAMLASSAERLEALEILSDHVLEFCFDPVGQRVVELAVCVDTPNRKLVDEVLDHVVPLAMHYSGHHVLVSALVHGSVDQQHAIATALQDELVLLSMHQHACHVVKKALLCCPLADQMALASALFRGPQDLSSLAENIYGVQVVATLLRLPASLSRHALRNLHFVTLSSPISRKAKRVLLELQLHSVEH